MKKLNQLSLKSKLSLFTLIPIMGLLYFALSYIFSAQNDLHKSDIISYSSKSFKKLDDLLKHTQRERGLSISHSFNKSKYVSTLNEERQSVNNALRAYKATLGDLYNVIDVEGQESYLQSIEELIKAYEKIDDIRVLVSDEKLNSTKIIAKYNKLIEAGFKTFHLFISHINDRQLSLLFQSYLYLNTYIDELGIKRALSSTSILDSKNNYSPQILLINKTLTLNAKYFSFFAEDEYLATFRSLKSSATGLQIKDITQNILGQKFNSLDSTRSFNTFTAHISEYNKLATRVIERFHSVLTQYYQKKKRSLYLNTLVTLIIVVCCGFSVVYITNSISVNANKLLKKIEATINGDLRQDDEQEYNGNDELQKVYQYLTSMRHSLHEIVSTIKNGVVHMSDASSKILTVANQVSSNVTETASAISETASTVEEVKQTANISSDKAKTMGDLAKKSFIVMDEGNNAVSNTIASMNKLNEKIIFIADCTLQLTKKSKAIKDIINSVNMIAEQSNLLAVNASIEAAKAGEHGKGFLVVSQEMRNLSTQSKKANKKIEEILEEIQVATEDTVLATEDGGKAAEEGVQLSQFANTSIESLVGSITETEKSAKQVTLSAEQQLSGIEQVNIAISNINKASNQNLSGVRSIETSIKDLDNISSSLSKTVEKFKV